MTIQLSTLFFSVSSPAHFLPSPLPPFLFFIFSLLHSIATAKEDVTLQLPIHSPSVAATEPTTFAQ
jgi:hypothetical protein